jgi:probable rRNA maturation factor
MHEVEIQRAVTSGCPADSALVAWATAALSSVQPSRAVLIRLVDEDESRQLNRSYRNTDRPTNVLSFGAGLDEATMRVLGDADEAIPLGDLVICASVVREEADGQGKSEEAHWAHMVIHGVLHLLGHDHQHAGEAEEMESLEREIMAGLGFADPYAAR